MYSDITSITAMTSLIAVFSLMWFITGIVIGRVMPDRAGAKPSSGGRSGSSRRPRNSDRSGGRSASRNGSRGAQQNARGGSVKGSVELYVGNLPYSLTKKDLAKVFSPHGEVVSVRLIESKSNGKPKGFGFVEMKNQASASAAAKALHSTKIEGRAIVVSEAKSRDRRD